jgi:DNA modification methylase
MKKQLVWKVQKRKVSELVNWDKNPRLISEESFSKLKERITKRGFHDVIKIDTNNIVLSGNQRKKALEELGIEEVNVLVPERPLSENEREAVALESNRVDGTWDWGSLEKNFDINLLLETGFDSTDLSHIFDDNLEVTDDSFDEETEIKKAKTTNIKSGDMFALGKHFLICADSTNPETVKKLVGEDRMDLLNIDFPYNLGVDYSAGLGGKQNYGGTINDKKTDSDYKDFLTSILSNALSVTKKDCHVFAWLDEKYIGMMQEIYKTLNIDFKRLCLWAKGSHNPTPQIAFNRAVELCMYGVKGAPFLSDKIKNLTEFQNKEIGTGNRLIDDILDIFQIWLVKRLPGNEYLHPTMKPPTLYEKSLRRCSKPGDKILDLCGGSGSLLVACECLKRRAYIAECEPVFCQLIINRFKQISNEKITKLN